MKHRWLALLACTGVVIFAACGSDDTVTALGTDGGQGDGGNASDGATSSDGATNSDANPGGDGGGDSGGGATSVKCGTTDCSLPGPCCVRNASNATCMTDGGACRTGGNDVSLTCASAADCSGAQVCCMNASLDPPAAACASTCNGGNEAMLCDPTGTAAANRCGDAGACGNGNIDSWGLTDVYGTCGDLNGPL